MDVEVEQLTEEPWQFAVTLLEDDVNLGEYHVTMSEEEYSRYGDPLEPTKLIQATFRFLLERENPEMIMERFSLSTVERYFPEYPEEIEHYAAV